MSADKKEDLRIRRTRKLLKEAMFELLETMHYEDISIVDICDRAMVHRATFYKHFKDKEEFTAFVIKEKLNEYYLNNTKLTNAANEYEFSKNMIEVSFEIIEENKKIFKLAADSPNKNLISFLCNITSTELLNLFRHIEKKTNQHSEVPVDMLANFIGGGYASLVCWWLSGDSSYSKNEIIEFLVKILTTGKINQK